MLKLQLRERLRRHRSKFGVTWPPASAIRRGSAAVEEEKEEEWRSRRDSWEGERSLGGGGGRVSKKEVWRR